MKDNMEQDFGINRTESINDPPSIISMALHNILYFKSEAIIDTTNDIAWLEKQIEEAKNQLKVQQTEISKLIEDNNIPYPVTLTTTEKLVIIEKPHRGHEYPNITKRNLSVINE